MLPCLTVNHDFINKYRGIFSQLSLEHLLHHTLEGCWRIGQAKWYDQELEVTMVGPEGRLLKVWEEKGLLLG